MKLSFAHILKRHLAKMSVWCRYCHWIRRTNEGLLGNQEIVNLDIHILLDNVLLRVSGSFENQGLTFSRKFSFESIKKKNGWFLFQKNFGDNFCCKKKKKIRNYCFYCFFVVVFIKTTLQFEFLQWSLLSDCWTKMLIVVDF